MYFILGPVGNASEPEIVVVASFPEDNPFGHVVNGEKNKITLAVENKSGRNVTLTNVAGSFHDPETNNVIKNVHCSVSSDTSKSLTLLFSDDCLGLRYSVTGRHKIAGSLHFLQRVSVAFRCCSAQRN